MESPGTLPAGFRVFSKYVVVGKLAQGGMAEVYLAYKNYGQKDQKLLVIKRIQPELKKNPQPQEDTRYELPRPKIQDKSDEGEIIIPKRLEKDSACMRANETKRFPGWVGQALLPQPPIHKNVYTPLTPISIGGVTYNVIIIKNEHIER